MVGTGIEALTTTPKLPLLELQPLSCTESKTLLCGYALAHRLTGDTLGCVDKVTVRELRNSGGEVLRRVEHGERIVITRDGTPVAELRPLPRSSAGPAELIRRRKNFPQVDPGALRRDIDNLIDPSL